MPCYFSTSWLFFCWWYTGRVEKLYYKEKLQSASIRFPFSSTVKSGHGTFPLPQLCVYLSQPLSVLEDLTWEDKHMPSNCLPDGVVFSPAPHVLISCICGWLCPLVPLSFLLALSIHAFFSLHIHVSIHPWIHTAQTTHPPLPKPLSTPGALTLLWRWLPLGDAVICNDSELWSCTTCVFVWRNSLHKAFFFFKPITCCTNRLLG